MSDREKTPAELHREKTWAERQARIREQAKRDEEGAARRESMSQAREKAFAEHLERIDQARANQAQARADFDALGELMEKTIDRKELIELGRKRQDLAPYIGRKFVYESHCWNCPGRISSTIHARCIYCRWYICSRCGSCSQDCDRKYSTIHEDSNDPFLPDYPDDYS